MEPHRFNLAVSGLLLLTGCMTVGPDYKQPKTVTPANWTTNLGDGLTAKPSDPQTLDRWWTVLNDPVLLALMERARAGNLDVRQAEARLRKSRAERGIAKADLFPTISANGSASRTRSSKESGAGMTANHFANNFDASWELDLFGGRHDPNHHHGSKICIRNRRAAQCSRGRRSDRCCCYTPRCYC